MARFGPKMIITLTLLAMLGVTSAQEPLAAPSPSDAPSAPADAPSAPADAPSAPLDAPAPIVAAATPADAPAPMVAAANPADAPAPMSAATPADAPNPLLISATPPEAAPPATVPTTAPRSIGISPSSPVASAAAATSAPFTGPVPVATPSTTLPPQCSGPSTSYLTANSSTVNWGFYDLFKDPVAYIQSGDVITVEVVTHEAGNDWAKMIQGDPGVSDIYYWATGTPITTKNVPKYPGSGSHVVTGPIYVCGAQPGDVLQVEILSVKPRVNPASGKTYGANRQAFFGYQARAGHRDGSAWNNSIITIYDISEDKDGMWALPVYQFEVPKMLDPNGGGNLALQNINNGVVVPHPVNYGINNNEALTLPYPAGFQTTLNQSTPINYLTDPLNYRIPLRPHLGIMGVMPANGQNYLTGAPNGTRGASAVPPSRFGGNIDDWRIGPGTTMYYTVETDGARLVMADTHAAQGDSELQGTAIETSFDVTVQVSTLKAADLPDAVQGLSFPLLETPDEYIVHGYTYQNYLDNLTVPSTITVAGADLNGAFAGAYNKSRDFLMDVFGLSENVALSIITTSVDYSVSQVVDSNWGVHAAIKKNVFSQSVGNRKLLEFYADTHGITRTSTSFMDTARRQAELRTAAAARKWSLEKLLKRFF
ncbi:acetamidase/formamidase [Klebsormidium nitens]|uniref:Acetamidase/formamidase n=1 Tax=Klebsormidium nitens TaxID=105231 RepID=A0A1Y1HQB4_KLENI|nr:acetamidase/formamidase [Klebsormidium nitens]|eukprot:GAQ79982.1 acetamidase/formamidase [Klebsormidium nitens]